ncbi:hypothetical protein [Galbibacter mesophilus]|uniref:hypothetical protein n=1 Tax=Galbibacter mesophilus TaxID=379069 RepID=UPI00191F2D67|nr:hypothetical protein [Galbibacter mesophilus]MCM5663662.1 hypothetical protein [Galbibacter mesophilus]
MKKDKRSELYKDYPELIEGNVIMEKANSKITIYSGTFLIKDDKNELKINGEIHFSWFPSSGTYFSGIPTENGIDTFKILNGINSFEIIINDLIFGNGFITNSTIQSFNGESKIKGVMSQEAVSGDKSISVDSIKFSVPNLRSFLGITVKKLTEQNSYTGRNRLKLENEKYLISIDKAENYSDLKNNLRENGGYIILYNGLLKSKKGAISFEESKEIFHCLNTFLTFLNGRRVSALFATGLFEDKSIWCNYTDYYVDIYKDCTSWPQDHSIMGLEKIWGKFSELWKDKEDRNFLTSVIHWYVEANNNSGFSEGAIIMAQTALELLYNWWIIENKKIIIGKDSENINASNKIRLLLSQLEIDHSVPTGLTNLQEFVNSEIQIIDACDAVVQIRNAIVHSQEEKRKKLSSINFRAKYEALELCIWYIEMALLGILKYDDTYYNRTSKEFVKSKAVEFVPWSDKKIQ